MYQIYPRSFADGSGDGVGDLRGLLAHLDHLQWLGVDCVWLSPVYPSPMFDFGYDVSDYCDVDPLFGSLADLDELVEQLHRRDMRLVLDWVPNHTSHLHPWFVESRSSRTNPKRSWYWWRDRGPDGELPNNWTATFTFGPAWTDDPGTGQVYLHQFLPEQPDLNWSSPELEAAMHDVLRFWLDRGVDGFRIDVVQCLGKDPAFPDDPPDWVGIPHSAINDVPETHPLVRGIRRVLEEYDGDRVAIGEVYLLGPDVTERTASYLGDGDELHLAFDFSLLRTPWDAARVRRRIEKVEAAYAGGRWPTWVLSNHDNPRQATRLGSEARARAAAVLLLTLRGTPFLFAGEELGLEDAVVPADRVVDPGGRDGCRAPIPWEPADGHGWPADPWLPFPPDAGRRSAAAQRADPDAIVHLYRRLLAARRASPALALGSCTLLDGLPAAVVGWRRDHGGDSRTILVAFGAPGGPIAPSVATGTVEVASDGVGEGAPFDGILRPDQAVVLRP